MDRNVSQVARILGVDKQQVKAWAWAFKDHLSGQANPGAGRPRGFSDSDVLALIFVALHWEDTPDLEAIRASLNCQDQFDDHYREMLYQYTPILQGPPDGLDETWRHGVFLNGGTVDGYLALARSYKESADALLDTALKSGEPREWGYPVLFAYRHTLELYLKVVGEIGIATHSLKKCITLIEQRHGQRIPSPAREWIIELDDVDPGGTAFRYADDEAGKSLQYAEHWVDFVQFKYAMACVFRMLDHAALRLIKQCPCPNSGIPDPGAR